MLAVPFSVLTASFSSAKSSLQFCLPGLEDQDCVWTFVLSVIWKTLLIPYLLLPSFPGCSLSPAHSFYVTILVAPFGSTGTWGECPYASIWWLFTNVAHSFVCLSLQLSLTFRFFCVTGTPWAGVFREQSVATVICLSELSSQITQDSVCQGPARHRPAGRPPAPLCSHTASQGQLGFLPTEQGRVGAFLPEKGFPHHLIIWGFIAIFVE